MPKIKTPYWQWQEDATTVPPKHPGERWKYPNDPEEDYRIMSKKDADSTMAARAAQSKKGSGSIIDALREPDDRGLKGVMQLESKGGQKPNSSKAGSVKKISGNGPEPTDAGSIVDFLKGVGRKAGVGDDLSTFDMRKHIFETYDLGLPDEDYKGTGKQNIALLKELKKEYTNAPEDLITELASAVKKKKADAGTPKEGVSDQDSEDLMEQNSYDIDPVDIDDGTWDEYVSKVKKKKGGPSFAEYKRGKSANLLI